MLAVCDFDFKFIYLLAGWEGSAHDSRVIRDAYEKGFVIPDGKFYLADAGYPLTKELLVPYRGVRYHLREQEQAQLRPENKEELFNLRHAQFRSITTFFVAWGT